MVRSERRRVEFADFCSHCGRSEKSVGLDGDFFFASGRGFVTLVKGWADSFELDPLVKELDLTQKETKLFNKPTKLPRLTDWMGDSTYTYSGIVNEAKPWTPDIERLRFYLRDEGIYSNSVLANFYRDGRDSISWHSDNEKGMGPTIASLSFGASRRFRLREKSKGQSVDLILGHGDLLVMHEMQKEWEHCLPKDSKVKEPRLNLTFRVVDHEV